MKKIEIDVTQLIEKIKKEDKLFYPVMMYVLLNTLQTNKDEIFYELDKGLFFKTIFHPEFDVFYHNYVLSCYEGKNQEVKKGKILFGLHEKNADFLLLPFKQKGEKTILPVMIGFDAVDDFEALCQKAVLSFCSY